MRRQCAIRSTAPEQPALGCTAMQLGRVCTMVTRLASTGAGTTAVARSQALRQSAFTTSPCARLVRILFSLIFPTPGVLNDSLQLLCSTLCVGWALFCSSGSFSHVPEETLLIIREGGFSWRRRCPSCFVSSQECTKGPVGSVRCWCSPHGSLLLARRHRRSADLGAAR